MDNSKRFPAFAAYFPVIGWIYAYVSRRNDVFVRFHLRQSIGLFLFLAAVALGWIAVGWLIAWIPYMFIFSIALFGLLIAAAVFAIIVSLVGMSNALEGRMLCLPIFGRYANNLRLI